MAREPAGAAGGVSHGARDLVGRLFLTIGAFVEDRPERGRAFLSPFDVVFSFHDIVEPDLVFVAPDQFDILTDKNIQGTPALVVEISPSTRKRDREIKRQLYDRAGVREYWLVDPEQDAVTIHRRASDGTFPQATHLFPQATRLTAQGLDTLGTPLLPGGSLGLARG
jgi:Uma2 family endonuclease